MNELDKDTRLLHRKLAKGFINRTQLNEILADLPDVQDQGEWFDPQAPEPEAEAAAPAEGA